MLLMIKRDGILYFEKFLQFPQLVHGFSTRSFGNMRPTGLHETLEKFTHALKIEKVVRMNQIHSSNVVWVTDKSLLLVDKVDGMLTSLQNTFLSAVTADCVPVLLYDKEENYVGIVHAGWRGVYKEILKEAIGEMIAKGTNPQDIIVGIGPCIRSCCYNIAQEHAETFRSKFPQWDDCLIQRDSKIFLDLPLLVKYQLRSLGILDTTIEDAEICTYDNLDLYSCRREGEGFGEFVGIIGLRD